jgi:glutamate synthase (NADPH/NADH) large chain
MTGGVVVVLGKTGRNFAAGMSGGVAYVYDVEGNFASLVNGAMVDVLPVSARATKTMGPVVRSSAAVASTTSAWATCCATMPNACVLIERHLLHTGSKRARAILDNWDEEVSRFVKVMPRDYARALRQLEAERLEAASVAAE